MITNRLRHNRVELALHELRAGSGVPLLLLHGLGERSTATVPDAAAAWPGSVHALDFTGHGASTVPRGGGDTCEVLMADVDTALGHLGTATLLGRGLGAYVALLASGARPATVRGAVLTDGLGLHGGATGVTSPYVLPPPATTGRSPDPFALTELSVDVRPPEYAVTFARHAVEGSGVERPVAVAAAARPAWLAAVAEHLLLGREAVDAALTRYAQA